MKKNRTGWGWHRSFKFWWWPSIWLLAYEDRFAISFRGKEVWKIWSRKRWTHLFKVPWMDIWLLCYHNEFVLRVNGQRIWERKR